MVGVVENPSDFDDEFALVAPGHVDTPETVTLLVAGSAGRRGLPQPDDGPRQRQPGDPAFNERAATALVTLSLAAVGLLLVALIAAAGFVGHGQAAPAPTRDAGRPRRHREARPAGDGDQRRPRRRDRRGGRHRRGPGAWAAGLGRVKAAAGHRIDGLGVPVWLLGAGMRWR